MHSYTGTVHPCQDAKYSCDGVTRRNISTRSLPSRWLLPSIIRWTIYEWSEVVIVITRLLKRIVQERGAPSQWKWVSPAILRSSGFQRGLHWWKEKETSRTNHRDHQGKVSSCMKLYELQMKLQKKKVRNQTTPTKQTNKHMEMNERTPRRLDMGKWACVQRRLKTKAESQVKSHFNWRRNYRPDGFWAERSQWRFKMAKPCQTPVKHSLLHTWLALQAGIL